MKGFENRNLLERDPYSKEVLEKLYKKAEKKIEPYRPEPEDFRDIYGDDVDKDIAETKMLEAEFAKRTEELDDFSRERKEIKDRIAYVAECIIGDQLSGAWLAGKGNCTPTSKFDDYKKGVDLTIEFPESDAPNRYLGLGIDITTSKDVADIHKKLDRILKYDILQDKVVEVKYFESEDEKRSIEVPRVIIALQDDQLKKMFLQEDRNDKDGLANNTVQLIILYQLQQQCTTFYKIAHRKDSIKAQLLYGRAQQMITEIIEEKQELFAANPALLSGDPATMAIWEYCSKKEDEMNLGEEEYFSQVA
jgi:hypothetical protein